ncbi:MAG: PAS domain S-box protein, partial [Deltaproteobacteria bacterium]|nr:PAS domain S-box protein [Deltaproteobacteria bacterium]
SQLSGYTFEELIGQPISDFIIPKFRPLFRNEYLKEIEKQGFAEGVVIFQAKDGNEHYVEYRNALVKQEGHKPYVSGLGRDITERILAERAVRESKERYKTVFETTGTATVIIEDDKTISLANSTFEVLSGYSKEEIEGKKKWTEFVIEDDMEQIRKYHRNLIDRPGSAPKNYEFRFIDRQGNIKNISLFIEIIPGTKNSVASLLNITDRKRAQEALQKAYEELEQRVMERTADLVKANEQLKRETKERRQVEQALRESQERYALATHAAGVGVWDWNVLTNEFYLDRNIKEILGYSDSEIPNELDVWSEYVHPEDRQSVMETFQAHVEGRIPEFVVEHRMIHKDGSVRWIMARGTAIRDAQGNPIRVVGTDTDITVRKQAEEEKKKLEEQVQQAQRLEAIGTLAGGMAHDFNNLLMAIQGNTSLLLYDMDSCHPHFDALKNIEKSVRSGAKLTKQLLGYARKGKYRVKPVKLNQLVEETADAVSRTKKEIIFHRELSEDLFAIEAEQGQIEQVLLNLYINAADSMPGGGKIIIKTLNVTHEDIRSKLYDPKPGHYVRLTVTDTGIGMDKRTQERIFEPFFTTKKMGRGTGLGLASVYGIIKSHGGYIEIESEKEHGTTFTIFLPAYSKGIPKTIKSSETIIEGSGTILLVDDEEIVLEAGVKMLELLGYRVLKAGSGKEAVEVYKDNKEAIDLVILDMIMPEVGGGETFDKIKKINPMVKVLLSSGYSLDGKAAEILKRGCKGFMQKPFNLQKLSGKVKELLVNQY